jgi:spore coat polysaccharide biosynthesis protein SpsF (cytidylyltransferase family)
VGVAVTPLRCVAIVQARVGSSRLPGKALLDIAGRPMVAHVVDRALAILGVDGAVLATTVDPADDALADFARLRGVPCTRGSENDVLDRFHQAVNEHPADVIIRVTADCPLLDPRVSGLVVAEYLRRAGDVDYVSNVHPPTYPDGLDTEVLSREALERAWREADWPSDREHVTSYIWRNAGAFRLANVATEPSRAHLRWTVDERADLEFVRAVYARLGAGSHFGMEEVIELLAAEPELARINAGFVRNEGYARSLRADDRVTVNPRRR